MRYTLLTSQVVMMLQQLQSTSQHRHSQLAGRRRGRITLATGEMFLVLQGATSTRRICEHLQAHMAPEVRMSCLDISSQVRMYSDVVTLRPLAVLQPAEHAWYRSCGFSLGDIPRLLLFRWVARPAAPPADESMRIPLELYHAHFAGDRMKAQC